MATSQLSKAIRNIRRVVLCQSDVGLTDGQLLDRFIEQRDQAAFAALVRRHGQVVWGVCCRVIGHHHDTEDAFQATFLVLARKAASVQKPALLANWLYGVAYRTALKARATARKRGTMERQVLEMPEPESRPDTWRDVEPLIDQELAGLPEKYRVAIILCDLEGKTGKEVARQLKIPEGTLSSRLRTARLMLAKRLTRHGLTLSGGLLATVLSNNAASAIAPTSVVSTTINAAPFFAAGQSITSVVSTQVASLTEGVLKAMLLTKLKIVTIVLLVLGTVAFGGRALTQGTTPSQPIQAEEQQTTLPSRTATSSTMDESKPQTVPSFVGKKKPVTSETAKAQAQAAYPVADLVVPIIGLDQHEGKTKEEWLIGKIVRSISPASWQANGGVGTIQYAPKTHSLIVTNSVSVQAQVKGLLETMRRVQDVEVVAETKVVSLSDAGYRTLREFLPKLAKDGLTMLSDLEAFALVRKAGDDAATHVVQAPKITFFPGQRVRLSIDPSQDRRESDEFEAKLTAHVAVNLQHIDLDVRARIGKTDFVLAERVIDGATLAQVKRDGNRYLVLLVTPRVILNIEVETDGTVLESATEQKKTATP